MRRIIETRSGAQIGYAMNILIGYLCEFIHLPFTMPLETAMIIFQTNTSKQVRVTICNMYIVIAFVANGRNGPTGDHLIAMQSGMQVLADKLKREGVFSV